MEFIWKGDNYINSPLNEDLRELLKINKGDLDIENKEFSLFITTCDLWRSTPIKIFNPYMRLYACLLFSNFLNL